MIVWDYLNNYGIDSIDCLIFDEGRDVKIFPNERRGVFHVVVNDRSTARYGAVCSTLEDAVQNAKRLILEMNTFSFQSIGIAGRLKEAWAISGDEPNAKEIALKMAKSEAERIKRRCRLMDPSNEVIFESEGADHVTFL